MTAVSLPVLDGSSLAGGGCGEPAVRPASGQTTVGNYFIANYPPFAHWTPERAPALRDALSRAPEPGTRMGVYVHIPFCRKRCHFCYFRVYTDKNARQIRGYLDAVLRELEIYAGSPMIGGRSAKFVYFGGGTPSYLSPEQLTYLAEGMQRLLPWDGAEEVTLEAEPGTLNERKLRTIRELGVTRLSLGIEHFDDAVLELNGRAHRSREIMASYGYARSLGFPEINIDLISGMLGETEEGWTRTVERTIALAPDTVTIYQMEIPYNTTIYRRMVESGTEAAPVADWETKRRWVDEAFAALCGAGYTVTSATTAVRDPARSRFVYRQGLFDGSDVVSAGVSAFGYVDGVNYQNEHDFDPYLSAVLERGLPTYRAYALSAEERYIREFALQLKAGSVSAAPFARRFGRDPREQFAAALSRLEARGLLAERGERIALTREGLLQVDRLLLEFFRPEHRVGRFA